MVLINPTITSRPEEHHNIVTSGGEEGKKPLELLSLFMGSLLKKKLLENITYIAWMQYLAR
jgi:hypothetical protein